AERSTAPGSRCTASLKMWVAVRGLQWVRIGNLHGEDKRVSLALTLKPQERIILGGAVLKNPGQHSIRLLIETPVPVLRQQDILPASEATTPCTRIYLAVELMYLQPDKRDQLQGLLLTLMQDVLGAAPSLASLLKSIGIDTAAGSYYRA